MNETVSGVARQLLDGGLSDLTAREQRVLSHIVNRRHVSRDAAAVASHEEGFGERLADTVARMGGSWGFIIAFVAFLALWVGLNGWLLARTREAFDPYPFIFLNLLLSMVAALQAPVILMSQNRQAARDRTAAGLDYEVNLKAEIEIMALHEKLDALRIDRLEAMLVAQGEQLRLLVEGGRPKL